ncbi:hypothetical protein GCM10027579_04840 [Calidifontibacter terrae]
MQALQELLDASVSRSTEHLRSIINDDRVVAAGDVVRALTGMKVISVATVTARGEPRISALDGHFLFGSWTFSTAGDAAKAGHLQQRPAVSVSYVDGEAFALFAHGDAERLLPDHPDFPPIHEHWSAHYGSSPLDWGPDIRFYRLRPHWMVAYAADREAWRGTLPAPAG